MLRWRFAAVAASILAVVACVDAVRIAKHVTGRPDGVLELGGAPKTTRTHDDLNRLESLAELLHSDGAVVRSREADFADARVWVNEPWLDHNGDVVRVHWENIPHQEGKDDWIALMYGGGATLDRNSPIKWKALSREERERGYIDVRMLTMGEFEQFFVYAQGRDIGKSVDVIARSGNVFFNNVNEPVGVHLALTGSPTEMLVQWTVFGTLPYDPFCYIGKSADRLDTLIKDGANTTYTRDDMCGSPANDYGWIDPGR